MLQKANYGPTQQVITEVAGKSGRSLCCLTNYTLQVELILPTPAPRLQCGVFLLFVYLETILEKQVSWVC